MADVIRRTPRHTGPMASPTSSRALTPAQAARAYVRWYDSLDSNTRSVALEWYREARREAVRLADAAGTDVPRAAAVIAVTSPNTKWAQNVETAYAILTGQGREFGYGANRRKAYAIRDGADPSAVVSGPKVVPFWQALCGDPDARVIDLWMIRAAGRDPKRVTTKDLVAMRAGVALGARRRDVADADFQAVVWCAIRGTGE